MATNKRPSLDSCCNKMTSMVPEMRGSDPFNFVDALMVLLLVNPASSATAERSFSSLRRLKTYLRSTCGQRRLNNIAICHVHKDVLDELNVNDLMNEFSISKESCAAVFGGY
jgi:hAT family C-terminal dimerisation region